jgi:predicted metalloprotease with PDZ domain
MNVATRPTLERAGLTLAAALTASLAVTALPDERPLAYADSDRPGDLGIVVGDLPCNLPAGFDPKLGGALVLDVVPGGPAEKGGVNEGDIVLKFDMQPVANAAELSGRIRRLGAGRLASMFVWRNGREVYTGLMTLAERRTPFADHERDERHDRRLDAIEDDVRDLERTVRDLSARVERLESAGRTSH